MFLSKKDSQILESKIKNLENSFDELKNQVNLLENKEIPTYEAKDTSSIINSFINSNFILKRDLSSLIENDKLIQIVLTQLKQCKEKISLFKKENSEINQKIAENAVFLEDLIIKKEEALKMSISNAFKEIEKKQEKVEIPKIEEINKKITSEINNNNKEIIKLIRKATTIEIKNDKDFSYLEEKTNKIEKQLNSLEERYNKSVSPSSIAGRPIQKSRNKNFEKMFEELSK
nr:MAG TPA: hypothetical protein [Caudoviricetes sp.]